MFCAFLNWDAVSRSYKYLERMTFVPVILDSSKSNKFSCQFVFTCVLMEILMCQIIELDGLTVGICT